MFQCYGYAPWAGMCSSRTASDVERCLILQERQNICNSPGQAGERQFLPEGSVGINVIMNVGPSFGTLQTPLLHPSWAPEGLLELTRTLSLLEDALLPVNQ